MWNDPARDSVHPISISRMDKQRSHYPFLFFEVKVLCEKILEFYSTNLLLCWWNPLEEWWWNCMQHKAQLQTKMRHKDKLVQLTPSTWWTKAKIVNFQKISIHTLQRDSVTGNSEGEYSGYKSLGPAERLRTMAAWWKQARTTSHHMFCI